MGWAAAVLALLGGAAMLSAGLIVLLRPLLRRYALARPNARSSHTEPTPQGAGIAVIAATFIAAALAAAVLYGTWSRAGVGGPAATGQSLYFLFAVLGLGAIGFLDDVAPVSPMLRLGGQAIAAFYLLLALPELARLPAILPHALEMSICLIGLVWFINLTNFMDGIDGMTVAGLVPALGGIAYLALALPRSDYLDATIALALAGALLGFAPFNRHVAQVFLGDVGSLAVGGMVGWLLLNLACAGQLIAALILPLYYVSDTGVTLFRRWRKGANLAEAHREHFYQQALASGFSVPQIVNRVWALNATLAVLAGISGTSSVLWAQVACLVVAGGLTVATLHRWRSDQRG